jgi:hypothetical protein
VRDYSVVPTGLAQYFHSTPSAEALGYCRDAPLGLIGGDLCYRFQSQSGITHTLKRLFLVWALMRHEWKLVPFPVVPFHGASCGACVRHNQDQGQRQRARAPTLHNPLSGSE